MIIDFNDIEQMTIPCMNNGEGMMTVRMYHDESYRIIPTTIHPGRQNWSAYTKLRR